MLSPPGVTGGHGCQGQPTAAPARRAGGHLHGSAYLGCCRRVPACHLGSNFELKVPTCTPQYLESTLLMEIKCIILCGPYPSSGFFLQVPTGGTHASPCLSDHAASSKGSEGTPRPPCPRPPTPTSGQDRKGEDLGGGLGQRDDRGLGISPSQGPQPAGTTANHGRDRRKNSQEQAEKQQDGPKYSERRERSRAHNKGQKKIPRWPTSPSRLRKGGTYHAASGAPRGCWARRPAALSESATG